MLFLGEIDRFLRLGDFISGVFMHVFRLLFFQECLLFLVPDSFIIRGVADSADEHLEVTELELDELDLALL